MTSSTRRGGDASSYIKRTLQDVTLLKTQIEELKKDSIKKEDLLHMQEKIAKIIQRASVVDNSATTSRSIKCSNEISDKLKTRIENSKNNNIVLTTKRKEFDSNNFKKCIKKSSNAPTGRIEKNSNKMFKKLEQSFAVNLCLCSGQEAPNKLTQVIQRKSEFKPSSKQKKSKDLVANIPSVRQTKPISTMTAKENDNIQMSKSSARTLCPSDCVCFHKIPSNTSIDKLLEKLIKWNGSLNQIAEAISSNPPFAIFKKQDETLSKSLLSETKLEKIKPVNDVPSRSVDYTTMSYQFSNEAYNKSTICDNTLPLTTESEYIGTINLDKSNYNICQCPLSNKNMKHSNGKNTSNDIPFHCINTDVCKCNSLIDLNTQQQERQVYATVNSKKVSQVYLSDTLRPQFKCIETETDSLNENISIKNTVLSKDTYIHDVVRKSQLFPCNCDYLVKFLGVTLTNANSTNQSKQVKGKKILKPLSDLLKNDNVPQAPFKVNMKENEMELFPSTENSKNKENLLDIFKSDISQNKCADKIRDKQEDVCVCCNNQEHSKDLELNAFNLLEEHIKDKLSEFQRFTCKSTCIPPEEEKKLFSTILVKVREVISESTKSFTCKCCDENNIEGSWARAYGLLQEYLRVKIQRVQCSCTSNEENVQSILPPILEKVCDLIENDFQRLKEKCKCDNEAPKNCRTLFNTENSITAPITRDNVEKSSTKQKENNLFKISNCVPVDVDNMSKSYELKDSMSKELSISEKKVSCEFEVYGTDCKCDTLTKKCCMDKKIIVNQFTEILSMKDNNFGITISSDEVHNIENSSFAIKNCESIKENTEKIQKCSASAKQDFKVTIPYIGCTLSSKSLKHTDAGVIDNIWKSLTDQNVPKNCSYIMEKAINNVSSDNKVYIQDNISSIHLSNFQSVDSNKNSINDIEVTTFNDNNEDIVLKHSYNKCDEMYKAKTFDETTVGTNESDWYQCKPLQRSDNYQSDTIFDKNFLYESLNLPTATDINTPVANGILLNTEDKTELQSTKCDCNMVPVCHVKMLVENIEKKLVHLQCTCDSLSSQACPIHSRGEFYFD